MTLDPTVRVDRALAAAFAEIQAGGYQEADELLAVAELEQLSDFQRACADLVRAQLSLVTNRGSEAPPLLLEAARRLERVDPDLSRATYLDALSAAISAGRFGPPGGTVTEVARLARAAPVPPGTPRASDLLLDGTARSYTDGYAAGLPTLREALKRIDGSMSADEERHLLWIAATTALRMWDVERWDEVAARHVQLARETGALSELPLALTSRCYVLMFQGDLTGGAMLADEAVTVRDATGSGLVAYGVLGVAAFRGDEVQAKALLDTIEEDVAGRGEGVGITIAEWAMALLYNGLGRYSDALAAARRATSGAADPFAVIWALVETVVSAVRTGAMSTAHDSYDQLAAMTSASGTEWALGLQARSQALICTGPAAEDLYREAITRLERTPLRPDLARARLLYGEWLRRERRPLEARENLRAAYGMFESIGMIAFAERALRELRAAGGTTRRPAAPTQHVALTAQEAQIARMARDGLTNPEIGTRLFLSARTIQYHLSKVFTKLDIGSRSQLEHVLKP